MKNVKWVILGVALALSGGVNAGDAVVAPSNVIAGPALSGGGGEGLKGVFAPHAGKTIQLGEVIAYTYSGAYSESIHYATATATVGSDGSATMRLTTRTYSTAARRDLATWDSGVVAVSNNGGVIISNDNVRVALTPVGLTMSSKYWDCLGYDIYGSCIVEGDKHGAYTSKSFP